MCYRNPLGKYFNIELKSIVAQHENLATKGIFGVRVPLQFVFSFRLNQYNPRDFFTDQNFNTFQRFWYKMCYHNPLGKYFNIELKSIVAQQENLAAKGIFGV